MKIRCIAIDDEQPAREIIETFASRIPYLELVQSFKNPLKAADFLNSNPVDLVFLDIQMPEITGIDILQTLLIKPQVIFTTAYSEFALTGFEVNATDYLLKPFSFERFLAAVHKARERMNLDAEETAQGQWSENITSDRNQYLTVNSGHKIHRLKLSEIHYIEGLKEYVSFYTTSNQRIVALKSLKSLEEELPSAEFIRVHRSYIVPIGRVKSLEGNQLLIGEKLIPLGRSYREKVIGRVFSS